MHATRWHIVREGVNTKLTLLESLELEASLEATWIKSDFYPLPLHPLPLPVRVTETCGRAKHGTDKTRVKPERESGLLHVGRLEGPAEEEGRTEQSGSAGLKNL